MRPEPLECHLWKGPRTASKRCVFTNVRPVSPIKMTIKITKHTPHHDVTKMEYGAHRCSGMVHWEQKHNHSKGLEFGVAFLPAQ